MFLAEGMFLALRLEHFRIIVPLCHKKELGGLSSPLFFFLMTYAFRSATVPEIASVDAIQLKQAKS